MPAEIVKRPSSASSVTKKRRRRQRRKPSKHDFALWQLSSLRWDYTCGFGIGGTKFDDGPFREHSSMAVRGVITFPDDTRYRRATIAIYGGEPDARAPVDGSPNFIGLLYARGDELTVSVTMPMSRIRELLILASSGQLRSAQFISTTLRYRQATVRNVQFSTEIEQ
jgi:hypothetical protein